MIVRHSTCVKAVIPGIITSSYGKNHPRITTRTTLYLQSYTFPFRQLTVPKV